MPQVTEEMMADGLKAMRHVAGVVAHRGLPHGLGRDDLESAGNEAMVEAVASWDVQRVGWITHVRTVARSRMRDAIRAAKRHTTNRSPLETETTDGDRLMRADPNAIDPADAASEREEAAPPPDQRHRGRPLKLSALRQVLPCPDEVAEKVGRLQAAVFSRVSPGDVAAVMEGVVRQAMGGDLKAARLMLDFLQPGRPGVTVQQAVIVGNGRGGGGR